MPKRPFPRGAHWGRDFNGWYWHAKNLAQIRTFIVDLTSRLQVEEDHLTVSSIPVAGRGPIETVVCRGYAITYNAAAVAKQDPILRALGMGFPCSHNDE